MRPLLAHYTSIPTLERILSLNEIWFSNPLYMNDIEELRFGIEEGVRMFFSNTAIRDACRTSDRYNRLADTYYNVSNIFFNEHMLDVYSFCLSEHKREDNDGVLSMWRGYGGNGSGAALVIDTDKLTSVPTSPLVIARVNYLSIEARQQWIRNKLDQFATVMAREDVPDECFLVAAIRLFNRIKVFSLLTKHHGFSEEKEWRIIYLKERDIKSQLLAMCDYAVGSQGLEPKLKLKIVPIEGVTAENFNDIVHQIILGPTVSHPLAKSTINRMLERVGKSELKQKVVASTIPFRSR